MPAAWRESVTPFTEGW